MCLHAVFLVKFVEILFKVIVLCDFEIHSFLSIYRTDLTLELQILKLVPEDLKDGMVVSNCPHTVCNMTTTNKYS